MSRLPALSVVTLGFASGLRSLTPLAAVALRRRGRRPVLATLAVVLAAGEIIADKLPTTPARTALGPLAGRLLLGAASASSLARGAAPTLAAALLGGAAAVAGAAVGYAARTTANQRLPDPLVAFGEDLLTIALSAWASRPARRPA